MKKALVFAAVAMLGVAAFGAASTGGVGATKPDDEGEHKVWICHVVEGQGELKNGYNLIEVDVAAVETEGHRNHVSKDGRRDIIPAPYGAQSQCIMPDLPAKPPVETEWIGPRPNCTAQSVEQTRTVTTYSYTFDPVAWTYVETATTTEQTRTLSLTPDEVAACKLPEEQSLPPAVPPPVGTTPAVVTPAVVTPAVQAAGATVAAAPTSLPTTGGETWTIFLIGLATLLTGAGLVTLSRRTA
jgi:LPXTG-motif cell wall-anchored protein